MITLETKKYKRAVIKEELYILTGNGIRAMILNQFLYWSERISDFDEFIEQENQRALSDGGKTYEPTHGWIYKTAEELADEIMLDLTPHTMRNYVRDLVSSGFISERSNPVHKWDRTKQYRVNLSFIRAELERLGIPLSGYPLLNQTETPKLERRTENNDFSTENISVQTEDFSVQTVPVSEQYQRLQTENTTENLCKKERRASAKAKNYDSIIDSETENYDSIIDSETENEQLREAYREFLKMRKIKKDPMTNHALKLLIGKVNKLSRGDEQCAKDLLDEAIISGWKSVYPPKNYNNTGGSINSNAPRSGDVFLDYLDEQLEIEQGK